MTRSLDPGAQMYLRLNLAIRCVVRAALAAVALVALVPTRAAAEDAGAAVVVNPEDGSPMSGGDSSTQFAIRLPGGAACPGDSEEGQYRVQSFLVPLAADPGTLRYEGLHPQTEDGWALYEINTSTFMNRPTARADEPGGEGAVMNLPPFSFAVFEPGLLPAGRYHLGIACSLFGATERHWSTEVEIIEDADDPAGISWRVVDPPRDERGGAGLAPLGLGMAGAAVAGALVLRRARAPKHERAAAP